MQLNLQISYLPENTLAYPLQIIIASTAKLKHLFKKVGIIPVLNKLPKAEKLLLDLHLENQAH